MPASAAAAAAPALLLLLVKRVGHPWTLNRGVKRRQGKRSSVTSLFLFPIAGTLYIVFFTQNKFGGYNVLVVTCALTLYAQVYAFSSK